MEGWRATRADSSPPYRGEVVQLCERGLYASSAKVIATDSRARVAKVLSSSGSKLLKRFVPKLRVNTPS
jgi:hypothetical protein